mgnify:CR=1 FL=1
MGIPTIEKVPGESRLFWMQCAARLAEDETISGVTSITITPVTLSPLTYTSGAIASGTVIQFKLTGGLTGTRYTVVIEYTTSLSNTRIGTGFIQVETED